MWHSSARLRFVILALLAHRSASARPQINVDAALHVNGSEYNGVVVRAGLGGLQDRINRFCDMLQTEQLSYTQDHVFGTKVCEQTGRSITASITELLASMASELGSGTQALAVFQDHEWGFAYLFYGAVLSAIEFSSSLSFGANSTTFTCWFAQLIERLVDAAGADLLFDPKLCGVQVTVFLGCDQNDEPQSEEEKQISLAKATVCFGSFLTMFTGLAARLGGWTDVSSFISFVNEFVQALKSIDEEGALRTAHVWDLCYTLLRFVIFFAGGGFIGNAIAILAEPLVKDMVKSAISTLHSLAFDDPSQEDLPPWVVDDQHLRSLGTECVRRVSEAVGNQLIAGNTPDAFSADFKELFSDVLATRNFVGGNMGIDYTDSGYVTAVHATGQAATMNKDMRPRIKKGNIIRKVDGEGFSEKLMKEAEERDRPYRVTFEVGFEYGGAPTTAWDKFLLHLASVTEVTDGNGLYVANNAAVVASRYRQVYEDGILSVKRGVSSCTPFSSIRMSAARVRTFACLTSVIACNGYRGNRLVFDDRDDFTTQCRGESGKSVTIENRWKLMGDVLYCYGAPQCFVNHSCPEWPFMMML